jgi:cell division protease FtsH
MLIFGAEFVTTGAQNDIERATDIARNMVTKWGLSERLGPLTYSEDDGEVFLGRSVTRHKNVSDETTYAIDEEIRAIINCNYLRSENILRENLDKLHTMAAALIKFETIDSEQINSIMSGQPVVGTGTDQEPPAGGSSVNLDKSRISNNEIGDPAQQH